MSDDHLEPLITQCPNCETRFRVTESQLQVAQGRVRCGACLGVFDGTAHLSLDGEDFRSIEEPTDVDQLLEELQAGAAAKEAAPPVVPTAPLEQPHDVATSGGGDDTGLPGDLLALEAQLLEELRAAEDDAEEPEITGEADSAAAADAALMADAQLEPPKQDAGGQTTTDQETTEQDAPAPPAEAPIEQQVAHASQAGPPEVPHLNIPEPVLPELEESTQASSRPSWFTVVLILLALIGLPAQVLWFQYESWVKDERFRPVYQHFCDLTGCELPPMRDVSNIASKKSVIRVHPERSDARIIDVLMVNNADFAQPFPLIELTATTIRGQLVAGRRFKPQEYLQGDMAEAHLMPPRTPVHVSLEIQYPGDDALNFEVRFR